MDQKANQLEVKKIDKDRGAVTSADLSQEVKEQMTGGSVGVVGKNSVLTENIVDGQVTPEKLSYSELNRDYLEFDSPQGKNTLTENGVSREVGRVELTGQMLESFTTGEKVSSLSFDKRHFPNTKTWPSFSEKITRVTGEFDKGEVGIVGDSWDAIENIGYHGKTPTLFFVFFEKGKFATRDEAISYLDTTPIEVFYSLSTPDFLYYPNYLSHNSQEIINLKIRPEKFGEQLTNDFVEYSTPIGKNNLTPDGLLKEVEKVVLTGDMIDGFSKGTNVDGFKIDIWRFPGTVAFTDREIRSTYITGEFDKGEFFDSTWDLPERVGYHWKTSTSLYIFYEKDRFLTSQELRNYIDSVNVEIYYLLDTPTLIPYPKNLSENTERIIDLNLRVKELEDKTENYISGIYNHIPLNKVTDLPNQTAFDLTYDGVVYCSRGGRNVLQKTEDFETFYPIYTLDAQLDYVFKLKNGSLFVVLGNGDIWLSDENENNFTLLTTELGGQNHQTNTSRAYVYNNIILVGEYAPYGTLGNRVFISTDYGKTFKISRLPIQIDRIDHTHSIVYDPYENLIWAATGDLPDSQRIFWSRDFGETWETHKLYQYRMTTIMPFPNYVLFGTDESGIMGTYKYTRRKEGVTPDNFIAYKDFAHIEAPASEGIFGWTSMPEINYVGLPYAYFGSRISHDFTSVGVGKIGVWKTDGKDYFTLWEYEGNENTKTPYGVSLVHGPDKHGRVMVYWIENDITNSETPHVIIFE